MTAWQVEKKLRNLESAPSWLQAFCHDFFCLPPLAAKKSCTPSLWTEARTAPTPPTTWSGRSSPLSQVKRKRKPFWRCFAHLIASAAGYLQRKFEQNYELDMSSLTIMKRNLQTFMFCATLHPTASNFFPSVASCDAERQKDQWPPTNMVQRWILEEHTSSFPRKRHDS